MSNPASPSGRGSTRPWIAPAALAAAAVPLIFLFGVVDVVLVNLLSHPVNPTAVGEIPQVVFDNGGFPLVVGGFFVGLVIGTVTWVVATGGVSSTRRLNVAAPSLVTWALLGGIVFGAGALISFVNAVSSGL